MSKKRVTAGIDVSSKQLVIAISGIDQALVFDNDEEGHKALVRAFKKRRVSRVGIEPTGSYGFDIMVALAMAGVTVLSINPRAARSFAKATMKRGKTDKVDAFVLLRYAESVDTAAWLLPRKAVIELRAISRRLQQIVKMVAAEKARLKGLDSVSGTPALVRESVEALIAVLEKAAEDLVDAGLAVANADPKLAKAIQILTSIRGVADRTAVKLLGELAVLPEDLTPRQLVAMAGLDPRPFESGEMVGLRRISKLGNAHLRGILFMAAHNAIRWEPVVGRTYDELVQRNKHHMKAVVAIMRKMLHAIWGMLRSESSFDPRLFRPSLAAA